MLELDGSIWFRAGSETWGGQQRIALLTKIGELGSITAAAKAVGLSYKAAWDAIDAMNNLADEPLVVRMSGGKGGGGTALTERARQLIATFEAFEREHRRFVEHVGRQSPAALLDMDLMRRFMLRTSARNKLFCRIVSIDAGLVNDSLGLETRGQRLIARITHDSVETLGLTVGREVIALVKASSVGIELPESGVEADNDLAGTVSRIKQDQTHAEIAVDLHNGGVVVAVIAHERMDALGLAEGKPVRAVFKASDIILGMVD
jgi:molybdate transport system regulatory protein